MLDRPVTRPSLASLCLTHTANEAFNLGATDQWSGSLLQCLALTHTFPGQVTRFGSLEYSCGKKFVAYETASERAWALIRADQQKFSGFGRVR